MDQTEHDPQGILAEMSDRSNDTVRVKNVSGDDYQVVWDSNKKFPYPKEKETVAPKYIAIKFIDEQTKLLIQDLSDKKMAPIAKKFKGNPNVHYPTMEEQNAIRTNNRALVNEFFWKMFVRVEEKFGAENTPEVTLTKEDQKEINEVVIPPTDIRSRTEQLMDLADEKMSAKGGEVVKSDKDEFAKAIT